MATLIGPLRHDDDHHPRRQPAAEHREIDRLRQDLQRANEDRRRLRRENEQLKQELDLMKHTAHS